MALKVGFIGLGRIGKPMAGNIAGAGFDLTAYDLREEPLHELARLGARIAHSPREVAEHAEIVELAVVDDRQVEEVIAGKGGLLEGCRPDTIIAIHSTIFPATVRKMGELAGKRGVRVTDAPVSGGEKGAEARELCYMVGGDKAVLEKCRPLFAASGSHIFHVGGLGSGATAKMILQVVVCLNMLAAHEAELLCGKTGVEPDAFQGLLRVSSGQSFVADHWLDRFKRPEDPMAVRRKRTEVFCESLAPALELARDLGISLHGAALARELLPRIMGTEEK